MNNKEKGWDDKREERAKERTEERRREIKEKFATPHQAREEEDKK